MFKEEITSYCKNCFELEQQLDQNKDRLKAKEQECERLENCLAEIKEIAEKLKNFYEELGKCEDLTVVRLKQILQKISEVEDEKI